MGAPLRLRRVKIHHYRGLRDVDLEFGDGPVFLLGKNGSGKTTVLELLSILASSRLGVLVARGEPVDVEWEVEREGRSGAPVENEHIGAKLRFEAAPEQFVPAWPADPTNPRPPATRWRLGIDVLGAGSLESGGGAAPIPGRFALASPGGASAEGLTEEQVAQFRAMFGGASDGSWLLRLFFTFATGADGAAQREPASSEVAMRFLDLGAHAEGRVFDEALSSFRAVFGEGATAGGFFAPSAGDRLVGGSIGPMWGRGFLRRADSTQALATFTMEAEGEPGLACRWLGAERIELEANHLRTSERFSLYTGFTAQIHWPGGVIHHHDALSFGQKRLLAFLWWASLDDFSPVFTDELTNGLHAEWMEEIKTFLGDRQSFHALQNPLLIDAWGPGDSAEDVRRRFVLCSVESSPEGRRWGCRNPTVEEAERLFQAWDVGFQSLSELLRTHGLW